MSIVANIDANHHNRMANSVDPDEMAHYEPSHQDLHYLQRYLVLVCRVERDKESIHLQIKKGMHILFYC